MSRLLVTDEIRRELLRQADKCLAFARVQIEQGNEHCRSPEHVKRVGDAAVALMVFAASSSVDRDDILSAIHGANKMLVPSDQAIRIISLVRAAAA